MFFKASIVCFSCFFVSCADLDYTEETTRDEAWTYEYYENGIKNGQFSYTTAVGLMKSLVSLIMVISANKVAHALGEEGLY